MGDVSLKLPKEEEECLDMPPGFRFHPTDEEIVVNYLEEKAINRHFTSRAIGEVDLNSCEPWDLPSKAKNTGEKEWYFFWQRDRKYPTGSRTNRATESGYWKATGKDKEIYKGKGCLVGMKKTLVFYLGRAPRGHKTSWVMHEYRLEGTSLLNLSRPAATCWNDWVVCRVFHKNEPVVNKSPRHDQVGFWESSGTFLPPLLDSPHPHNGNCGVPYSNISNINMHPYSSFYAHDQIPKDQTEMFQIPHGSVDMGYQQLQLHQECKVEEQFAMDQSLVNALPRVPRAIDVNVELAGGTSSFDGRQSPSCSLEPLEDLDNIWTY